MKPIPASRVALLAVAAASLAAALLLYRYVISPGGPLSWDESAHALWGALIAYDLRHHDWVTALYDTWRQMYWPPLNSWLAGLLFLAAGASDAAARCVSAGCLAVLPPLLFLAGRRLYPERGTTAGLIAASLALACPAVVMYSSRSMLEMPGLVAVTLTLLAFFRVTGDGVPDRWRMLVGLGLLACYFTKTNYAIVVGLALVVAEVTAGRTGIRSLFTRRYFYTCLPVAVALGVWFADPIKLRITWLALVNQPWGGIEPYGVEGLLFFPHAFVQLSGSIWIAAAYLVCLVAALWRWRDPRVRLLVALVAIQFFIGELHHTKLARHLLPVYPALLLLAGRLGAACWHSPAMSAGAARQWAMRGGILALVLYSGTLAWRSLAPPAWGIGPAATREMGSALRQPGGGLAVISPNFPCAPCLDWLLITRESALEPPQAGFLNQRERLRPRPPTPLLRRAFSRYAEAGKSRTYYGLGSAVLRDLIESRDYSRLAVVAQGPGSSDSLPAVVAPLVREASLRPVSGGSLQFSWYSVSGKTSPRAFRLDTYRK